MEQRRAADQKFVHRWTAATLSGVTATCTLAKQSTWDRLMEFMSKGETHMFAAIGKWCVVLLIYKHAATIIHEPLSLLICLTVLVAPKVFEMIAEAKLKLLTGAANGYNGSSGVKTDRELPQ